MQDTGHPVKSSNIKITGVPEEGERRGRNRCLKRQSREFSKTIERGHPTDVRSTLKSKKDK